MPSLAPLLKNFSDVRTPVECIKKGSVPSWLQGTILRNGPGIFKVGDSEVKHLFDGLAFVERYYFKDGKMMYSGRALDTNSKKKCMAANRMITSEFGTAATPDPCKTIFHRFFSYFTPDEISDNTLVAFTEVGDSIYALTERPAMVKVNPRTLDVEKSFDASKDLFSVHTCTAHHHTDNQGNAYNIGTQYGRVSKYIFTKINDPRHGDIPEDSPFKVDLEAKVDTSTPAYVHSFGMSENHFVLLESPLRMRVMKLAFMKYLNASFNDCMQWHEGEKTNVIIVNRKNGKKLPYKVTLDSCFTFHHANSFEKDGYLVVDICSTKNATKLGQMMLDTLRHVTGTSPIELVMKFNRFIVPLEGVEKAPVGIDLLKKCPFAMDCKAVKTADGVHLTMTQLANHCFEFPKYNYEKHNARPYRYCYGTCDYEDRAHLTAVAKVDTNQRKSTCWNKDHSDQVVSEPIFIADPEGTEEDDGVVVVPVMTTREGDHPVVVVLDAHDMSEMCRYTIPVDRIHMAFHMHYTQL